MSKRGTRLIAVAIVLAIAVTGIAYAANKATVIRLGNLVLKVNGAIAPTRLPKHEPAPIGFHASGDLATVDGTHPPAWKQSSFDIDKDVIVDVSGIPVCGKGQLQARTLADARHACQGSILGQGKADVEVAFAEQRPFTSTGPVTLFNGGERNGVITLYVHAYVAVPAPTAVVVTAKLTRESKGPYGLHLESSIPLIAGGAGSITHFELVGSRFIDYKGERHSFLFARCSDGHFLARGSVVYRDGTLMAGSLVRTCTAAG